MTEDEIEFWKLMVSIVGLLGTLGAAGLALGSYWRNEAWKRAEFLAKEMKDFLSNPRVQNALTMIDWAERRVALFEKTDTNNGRVRVTRRMQAFGLLPHTIELAEVTGFGAETSADARSRFTREEAAIRDCYDAFLDGLERFSGYLETRLVRVAELRPYLEYWVSDIAAPAADEDEAFWSAALLTYIHVYGYKGVQALFREFGFRIEPSQPLYASFMAGMSDHNLAARLRDEAAARTNA